jgi:hypothetical protein
MSKKLIAFLSILCLSLSVPLIPAHSATKTGAKCTKVGIKSVAGNKTFTCVKSGKKLVWNKGMASEFKDGLYEENFDGYFEDDASLFLKKPQFSSTVQKIDFKGGCSGKCEFTKQWSGYFIPNETGYWKFSVISDDASYIWLGKDALSQGIPPNSILNLAGIHAPLEANASVYVLKYHAYPIRIVYGNSINFAQMILHPIAPSGRVHANLALVTKHVLVDKSKPIGIDPNLKSIDFSTKVSTETFPVVLDVWKNKPRDAVALVIQKILNEAEKNPKTFNGNVTWVFQGYTSPEVEAATKRGLINGINLYTKLGFKTTNALVFNARDMTWLKSQLTEYGCKYGDLPNYAGFYIQDPCQNGNGAITAQHYDIENPREGLDGILFNHVLSHEYFHQIQEQLGVGVYLRTPLWFWEGGAQFFTLLAYSSWNTDRYYEQWSDYWFGGGMWDAKSSCKAINIFDLQNSDYGPDRHCGYSKGLIMTEFLISSFGTTQYQNIISEMALFPSLNFSQAFQKVTGADLQTFYSSAQVFLKSRGWDQ